jgi:pyridoxal phosphate enzyme (YggS family)
MGTFDIRDNLRRVRDRISDAAVRSGRKPEDIRLVAVTKTVDTGKIAEAVDAGVEILGENYVQEARNKQEALGRPVRWHMIGHLQSNKARHAVELFDVFETVDREKIIRELDRHARQAEKVVSVMIQLNLSGESSKSGAEDDRALELIQRAASCENLRCRGLMTIPPFYDDPENARPFFARLRELRDRLKPLIPASVTLDDLSMGMSGDFEVAIQEGATHVRIGTAIFGYRGK